MRAVHNSVAALAENACAMPWEDKAPFSARYAFKEAVTPELFAELLTIVQKLDAAARQSRNALEFSMLVDAFIEDARAALSKALGLEGEQQS